MAAFFSLKIMKKIISVLSILFVITLSCFSEIKFEIEPNFNTTLGKYGEYVYSYSGKSVVSYLEWQSMPLVKPGIESRLSFNNLEFSAGISYALPLKCGKMYDSDWDSYGVKTTYSISNNYSMQNYDCYFSIGVKIDCKKFLLIPEFSYFYYYDFFQSNDGEGWYGRDIYSKTGKTVSWDSPDARHYRKLSRIELKRESKYFFLGITGLFNLGSKCEFSAGSFIAPYASVYNSDYHMDDNGKGRDFYLNSKQEMNFSRFLEKVSFTYKINNHFAIPFSLNCIFGEIEKGMLEGYEQYAGTDVVLFNLKLGINYTL